MKKTFELLIEIVGLCLIFHSLSFAEPSKEITVSAAISLKNAFEEIGALYDSKYNTKAIFNFGASGDLLKQIQGGAPVDVFAPASQKDMNAADSQGLMIPATRADFASNSIVLIVPADAKSEISSFESLAAADIKKIALGNPKTVPAGRYAEEVFAYFKLLPALTDKYILAENVRQVLDYVARGEVDAGVVYATDAAARPSQAQIIATAPEESHTPVTYPIAVAKGTKNESAARDFISVVLSPEGRQILEKNGFKAIK